MESDKADQHILHEFDQELDDIRNNVMAMGGLVEEQLANGLRALLDNDRDLGEQVDSGDYRVNAFDVEIDEECTRIIALRQPAARDLRVLVTIIRIIADLERIGDEGAKLGRFATEVADSDTHTDGTMQRGVEHLGEHAKRMLHDTLDILARMDAAAAVRVAEEESRIDHEYEAVMRQLITHMMENPRSIQGVLAVMWCARSLERVADHARNICEYVVYMVAGKDIRHTSLEQARRDLQNQEPDPG